MFNKVTIETKNIKKFYVPKIMVIYFSDSDLSMFDNFSKNIVEYVEFVHIGSKDILLDNKAKRFNKKFYSWMENKKNEERIMKPALFFNKYVSSLVESVKSVDIAIIAYKSNSKVNFEYVEELVHILDKNDVFSFHYVVDNYVQSSDIKKSYEKFLKHLKRKRQVYIPIKEETIVETYQNANLSNRNYYANLYINNLIDLFVSPFLDPKRNQDAFSKTKALFYQSKNNFEKKVITSIGYSDSNEDYVDLALIQALSSPMFAAAFEASNTFIVDIKMPFFTEQHLRRINEILRSVVGDWKKFYVLTYVGPFESYKYCEASIMAVNVEEDKLIRNSDEIQKCIKKILNNVQKSKKLFESEATKEILLADKKINTLEN
ncbi:MAG: hypothetical protein HDR43_03050 [Mycoplasma sp.]|nr:hypothetical protein [Mycoplasma sp.]